MPNVLTTDNWKDRLTALVPIIGLPIAFLIWHWRDRNAQDSIESARKDINLKEFQEVQLRAAGALDEKLPAEARDQLQIAALHQLRGFLRGDYGEAFKRPAFELLLAGHAAAMERIGHLDQITRWKTDPKNSPGQFNRYFNGLMARSRILMKPVDRARAGIIQDEWHAIFRGGHSLRGRRFDLLDFSNIFDFRNIDLSDSVFIGTFFNKGTWKYTIIDRCRFDGANLREIDFSFCHGLLTSFEHCWLHGTDLSNSNFTAAIFSFSGTSALPSIDLQKHKTFETPGANFSNTILSGARLHGIIPEHLASCNNATYSFDTIFVDTQYSSEDHPTTEIVRESWRRNGARRVDEGQDD